MAKSTIELKMSLKKSKELAKRYSQFPVVKLQVWKELREKQEVIKKEMRKDVNKQG